MAVDIDLHELAARESEQVEWKEGVADTEDVVRTLVAFANDLANLGGGYVVCGAREVKDAHGFQALELPGLSSERLRQVEGKVLTACRERVSPPLAPLTVELPAADPACRVLVFILPATSSAHALRAADSGSRHYVRIGRETREARNGLLLELLSRKGARPAWDRRSPPDAVVHDVDLLALRDVLTRMGAWDPGRPVDELLSADHAISAMVPALCNAEPLTRALRPRHFTLLLFGREPQRFIYGSHLIVSMYPGLDRTDAVSRRYEIAGTVLQQAARTIELLDLEAHMVIDQSNMRDPNRLRYPARALHEAVINALVHRSYEVAHPVRVFVFADRVEIWSPGGLDRSVPPERFFDGVALPVWRNQALAWFFTRLRLAQAEGQGIAMILRTMALNGNPPPEFHVTEESVLCVLRAREG